MTLCRYGKQTGRYMALFHSQDDFGIAHLFEHLMFKATSNLADGEFDKIMEEHGAQTNAAHSARSAARGHQRLVQLRGQSRQGTGSGGPG